MLWASLWPGATAISSPVLSDVQGASGILALVGGFGSSLREGPVLSPGLRAQR